MFQSGKSEAEVLEILRQRSRDNGRTPMQWEDSPYAGFSTGTPWITPPDNFKTINAKAEKADEDSILNYYKALIRLRKENSVISDGQIEFLDCGRECVFAYRRFLDGEDLFVLNNLTENETALDDISWTPSCVKLLGNYPDTAMKNGRLTLRPYESVVYKHAVNPIDR